MAKQIILLSILKTSCYYQKYPLIHYQLLRLWNPQNITHWEMKWFFSAYNTKVKGVKRPSECFPDYYSEFSTKDTIQNQQIKLNNAQVCLYSVVLNNLINISNHEKRLILITEKAWCILIIETLIGLPPLWLRFAFFSLTSLRVITPALDYGCKKSKRFVIYLIGLYLK